MSNKIHTLKQSLCFLLSFFILWPVFATSSNQQPKSPDSSEIIRVKIIGMSDLHGRYLPYNHTQKRPSEGGLPYVASYVRQERADTTQNVIFLNGGDLLQGSMSAYYYNFLDTREIYMPSYMLGEIGVDASVMGNHDLDMGHSVYNRFMVSSVAQNSEVLGANVFLKSRRNVHYNKPYICIYRGGLKIAVLGLTTPVLTGCVATDISPIVEVRDMLPSAEIWMERIKNEEKPDLIIGLFHAGFRDAVAEYDSLPCTDANDPKYIAKHVPGFDGLILGHKHRMIVDSIHHNGGQPIWLIEPGYNGRDVAVLDFEVEKTPGQKAKIRKATGELVKVSKTQTLSPEMLVKYTEEEKRIATAADKFVAVMKDSVITEDALLGSSFYVDLVHKIQLDSSKAEVSFAAPLIVHGSIPPKDLTYSDLLLLYRFENDLVRMWMTGREIKDYLEYSYGLWINQMHSPTDRLLRTTELINKQNPNWEQRLEIPQYNFDSGAGLDYEVDVTKPAGQRISIKRMWSDRVYHADSVYTVVVNSYRALGAGGHMELGAKINRSQLWERLTTVLDYAQVRELIHDTFMQEKEVKAFKYNNWKFVPESYITPNVRRAISKVW
ncbi:MAG: bifunctional metallophosphatase/5'-nucleotidase [Bacteroidales bacterium]|jgi:2',3'-cyclic-nucleotide 2'-phosphodiesterase/3'-nucleotidase|nr:bifunctional metallophosphatase/5'-nucleotidase [Bacteroidales bacterium]